MDTKIVQYPNKDNNFTAICETTIGGYDYDPIEDKLVRVEYTDIGDANAGNCNKMIAPHYIRMASTRSQGRALRKYTNVDMVCAEELNSENMIEKNVSLIGTSQLAQMKKLLKPAGIHNMNELSAKLFEMFSITDHMSLTEEQGDKLIAELKSMAAANKEE